MEPVSDAFQKMKGQAEAGISPPRHCVAANDAMPDLGEQMFGGEQQVSGPPNVENLRPTRTQELLRNETVGRNYCPTLRVECGPSS
jgi:hypothetical protein